MSSIFSCHTLLLPFIGWIQLEANLQRDLWNPNFQVSASPSPRLIKSRVWVEWGMDLKAVKLSGHSPWKRIYQRNTEYSQWVMEFDVKLWLHVPQYSLSTNISQSVHVSKDRSCERKRERECVCVSVCVCTDITLSINSIFQCQTNLAIKTLS